MNIKKIDAILKKNNLRPPYLNVLIPDEYLYTSLLIQPDGKIETIHGVRNLNREMANVQFKEFLNDAIETQADLVISPEYSMPWDILIEAINSGKAPKPGKIWVLGCESIKYEVLCALKTQIAGKAVMLFEPLEFIDNKFVCPLVYVFRASTKKSVKNETTVMVVQFKTKPSNDPNQLELNEMQTGRVIYQFGNEGNQIKLVSLICSDAFDFTDRNANDINDRSLVIHIQLNKEPRHTDFLACRKKILGNQGDETELICLNWAENVEITENGNLVKWKNEACSAWYVKSNEFDMRDISVSKNQAKGFYYTWHKVCYAHTMFFNFTAATFLVKSSKVAHVGVKGAAPKRLGPKMETTCFWDSTNNKWKEQLLIDSGFVKIAHLSGNAKQDLTEIALRNPIDFERILAMTVGKTENGLWYELDKIDSFIIEQDEIIKRISFAQDNNNSAKEFRNLRLSRCGRLYDILNNRDKLPPMISSLSGGFSFDWSSEYSYQNVKDANGKRATVIYLGEDTIIETAKIILQRTDDFLRRSARSEDYSLESRQRLVVWYVGTDGQLQYLTNKDLIRFDSSRDNSVLDIGRQ